MVTQSKGWQEMIAPHAARFRIAGMFGHGIKLGGPACTGYAELLADMAQKLDLAHDLLDKKYVTSEGNDVS